MAETNMKLAKETYRTLLKAIEKNGWHCKQDDEKLTINFGVNGDDLHMDFYILVDAERQIVRLISKLPYAFAGDRRLDGAIATSAVNYALSDGSFDFDVLDGTCHFRMTTSYRSSIVSYEVFMYLVNYAAWAVDKFNDKLLMVSNGTMPVADFIEKYC